MASLQSEFQLGDWRVSPTLNRVSKDGQTVGIKHKSMAVLLALVEAKGEVLSRDEIMDLVWPGLAVTDDVLTQAIHELRHALGDDAKQPSIIETIPRVGIRLITEPQPVGTDADESKKQRFLWGAAVVVVALGLVWLAVNLIPTARDPIVTVHESTSIAILPFANRSNDEADAFFVEGVPDDLRTLLSKLSSVDTVISRTSTERYRDTTKPIPQIGQELGVVAILEGAVQRSGDHVRINVTLIEAESERDLWAESFDRELNAENLFGIQSEIAREIVVALHGVLSDQENDILDAIPTDDLEAYEAFVLGRQQIALRTAGAISRGIAYFENAIRLDPEYALAHAGLAEARILLMDYQGVPFEEIAEPAQSAVDRALSINPLLGEAYTSLAGLRQLRQRSEEAEKYYLRAIELSPGYATAYHWYASLLLEQSRDDEAALQFIRARELDPLSPVLTANLADLYIRQGRSEEARSMVVRAIERDPGFPAYYGVIADIFRDQGRLGEALRWSRAATERDSANPNHRRVECGLYLDLGDEISAEHCFATMIAAYPQFQFYESSWMHYYRGECDEGVSVLKQWEQETSRFQRQLQGYIAWGYVACGDPASARSILEQTDPDWFGGDAIVVGPGQLRSIVAAAYVLYFDGDRSRANYLFEKALVAMQSMRRTGHDAYHLLDVFIHVARGDDESAVQAMHDIVNSGKREGWWQLRLQHYSPMRENTEWVALLAELEADIRQQRQWFEQHKDDPLY